MKRVAANNKISAWISDKKYAQVSSSLLSQNTFLTTARLGNVGFHAWWEECNRQRL